MKGFSTTVVLLLIAILTACVINVTTGYIDLSLKDFLLTTDQSPIAKLRIYRVLVMLLVGLAIPSSGFVLQEYFQNPLAGPSVLGITSAASLSVAFFIFFFNGIAIPEYLENGFMSLSAIVGSAVMMLILLQLSKTFSDSSYLVIFGFLVSALCGAVVSLLQLYGDNQSLKNYVLWSFGANNQVSGSQLWILALLLTAGLFLVFKTIKPLIGNSLGTAYAISLGVDVKSLKYLVVLASAVLSASVTAFVGPILFIGIIVPHFCRMIYSPAKLWHQWFLNMLLGVLIMEGFSTLSELSQLPLNILISFFGLPVIVFMLIKNRT